MSACEVVSASVRDCMTKSGKLPTYCSNALMQARTRVRDISCVRSFSSSSGISGAKCSGILLDNNGFTVRSRRSFQCHGREDGEEDSESVGTLIEQGQEIRASEQ